MCSEQVDNSSRWCGMQRMKNIFVRYADAVGNNQSLRAVPFKVFFQEAAKGLTGRRGPADYGCFGNMYVLQC